MTENEKSPPTTPSTTEDEEEHDCTGPSCTDKAPEDEDGPDNDDWIHEAYLRQAGPNPYREPLNRGDS